MDGKRWADINDDDPWPDPPPIDVIITKHGISVKKKDPIVPEPDRYIPPQKR
jgi:hypothetical protein